MGKPIGEHDEPAQRIAFIAATALALEAMVDVSSRLADEKRNDIRIEAALAKLYGSEMGWRIDRSAGAGVRRPRLRDRPVAGGAGTTRGADRAGDARYAHQPHLRGLDGDHASAHRARGDGPAPARGRRAAGARRPGLSQGEGARGKAGAFYATWYPKLAVGPGQAPRSYHEYGELAAEMRYIERASRKLARSTFYAMARWQAATEQHGAFLGRIVDIGAELFAMSATVVYTQTAVREHPERAAATQELAKAFCSQSQHRTERLFNELWDNADETNHRLALDVLKGRHTWLEEGIIDPSVGDGPMVPSAESDRGDPVAAPVVPVVSAT